MTHLPAECQTKGWSWGLAPQPQGLPGMCHYSCQEGPGEAGPGTLGQASELGTCGLSQGLLLVPLGALGRGVCGSGLGCRVSSSGRRKSWKVLGHHSEAVRKGFRFWWEESGPWILAVSVLWSPGPSTELLVGQDEGHSGNSGRRVGRGEDWWGSTYPREVALGGHLAPGPALAASLEGLRAQCPHHRSILWLLQEPGHWAELAGWAGDCAAQAMPLLQLSRARVASWPSSQARVCWSRLPLSLQGTSLLDQRGWGLLSDSVESTLPRGLSDAPLLPGSRAGAHAVVVMPGSACRDVPALGRVSLCCPHCGLPCQAV